MKISDKIIRFFKVSWFKTIFFNFRYLPVKQAVKLPILLYNPTFVKLGGVILINDNIRFGMIQLGYKSIKVFNGSGIRLQLTGRIIFNGKCKIGHNSIISVGGEVVFGDNFISTTGLRIICGKRIEFGKDTLCGWDVTCMDSSFHRMKYKDTSGFANKMSKEISVGRNVWIAANCTLMPSTILNDYNVVAANTVLHKDYSAFGTYKLIGGNPVRVLRENVWLDINEY